MSAHDKTLYLEKLTVSFDGFKALNELTLQIEPGELRCIIGPNGAGKTTMMDVITGKTRPDSGTAQVWAQTESAFALRTRNRAGRNRPEISKADRVRAADGVRKPRAGLGRRQIVSEDALRSHERPRSTSESTRFSKSSASRTQQHDAGEDPLPRPEAMA